jgi:hypothetical protein
MQPEVQLTKNQKKKQKAKERKDRIKRQGQLWESLRNEQMDEEDALVTEMFQFEINIEQD